MKSWALTAFIDNLERHMKVKGFTSPQQLVDAMPVSAKVDQKTIARMLTKKKAAKVPEPRTDTVEAIARVFGLEAWQMLQPNPKPGEAQAVKTELPATETVDS